MIIKPDNDKLVYSGRIDWSNTEAPVFVFPCTSVKMKFSGKKVKIQIRNRKAYWNNYLGCILDGKQTVLPLPEQGEATVEVSADLPGIHEILLFKRQDSCHELTFLGFELEEGEILNLPQQSKRRIEVYGDSVSAGEVSEAVDYTGKQDPEHNGEYSNSWYSYAWMTARKLGAEIHDIAQGGIALMDNTGWFYEPNSLGMESVWNKVHYNPLFGEAPEGDFNRYVPQLVIVAIGQNDSHPEDYMKEDYNGSRSREWREQYKKFLKKLRSVYPEVYIICITTLLEHDMAWDKSIGQAVQEMEDKKITQYIFQRNGCGTPGHLRISEAEEMSEELADYIENLNIEGWE